MLDRYMPLGAKADPEEVRAFLEEVKLEDKSRKPKWESVLSLIGWYLMLLSILYFVCAGYPLWPGVLYLYWHWVHSASPFQLEFLIFFLWPSSVAWVPTIDGRQIREARRQCRGTGCF